MAKKKIKPADLSGEISRILTAYSKATAEALDRATQKTAEEGLEFLKKEGKYEDRTGEYREGFYIDKVNVRKGSKRVLKNKKYQLTHLLEFGHAKQNGGRTRAFPHWAQSEKRVQSVFVKNLEDELR